RGPVRGRGGRCGSAPLLSPGRGAGNPISPSALKGPAGWLLSARLPRPKEWPDEVGEDGRRRTTAGCRAEQVGERSRTPRLGRLLARLGAPARPPGGDGPRVGQATPASTFIARQTCASEPPRFGAHATRRIVACSSEGSPQRTVIYTIRVIMARWRSRCARRWRSYGSYPPVSALRCRVRLRSWRSVAIGPFSHSSGVEGGGPAPGASTLRRPEPRARLLPAHRRHDGDWCDRAGGSRGPQAFGRTIRAAEARL